MVFYQDLYIMPHAWTILHLLALFERHSAINDMPSYSDLKVPFIVDAYDKTPLHYLIAHDNIDHSSVNIMLNYILDYLEDRDNRNPYEYEMLFKSLTGLSLFIISRTSSENRDRFLSLCLLPSYSSEPLPLFGQPEKQYMFNKSPVITDRVKSLIYEEGQDQIVFETNMLHFDYHPASDDMLKLVYVLNYLSSEEIFKTPLITKLINHLWKKTQKKAILFGAIFSVLMIIKSVYIGIGDRNVALEILMLILTIFFIIGEVLQLIFLKYQYFNSMWNWIDITHLAFSVAYVGIRLDNEENIDLLSEQWVATIMITAGYLRWVSFLRLFTVTSKETVD